MMSAHRLQLALICFTSLGTCESFIGTFQAKRQRSDGGSLDINFRSEFPCTSVSPSCYGEYSTSRLLNSDNDDDESEKSSSSSTDSSDTDTDKPNIGQKIGFGLLTGFGYVTQVVSWLISAGLVLNIFGYGYEFNKEEGIHIDTLQRIRTDNQFKAEYERMGKGMDLSTSQQRRLLPKVADK